MASHDHLLPWRLGASSGVSGSPSGFAGLPRSPGLWGNAVISIQYRNFIWIEDVIKMVEEVIGQNHSITEQQNNESSPITDQFSAKSILSVEEIAKALGRKFSGNKDIFRFSVTVENLCEGFKTFAVLEGPQEQVSTG